MDIYVEVTAEKSLSPDEVRISFNFEVNNKTYESTLALGVKAVEEFVKLIAYLGFNKEMLKTRSFRLYKKNEYDYKTKKNIDLGYIYSQQASLKFDYDIKLVSKLMEGIAKLKNPPKYSIQFGLKNEESAKNDLVKSIYRDAKSKADAIAKSAGKKVKDCVKVSVQPFESDLVSPSSLRNLDYSENAIMTKSSAFASAIEESFVPEDVKICETLYYLFVTE